jgi:hypothetical protein
MEKMKSALEIALERTKSLEDNLKKELKEAEQQKYVKAARILGRSFLQGKTNKEAIKESIMRYPEEYREAALKAFLDEAAGAMDLTNTPLVLQAITFLTGDAKIKQACTEAEKLYRQYILKLKERSAELQQNLGAAMLKKLSREGIKGSALAGFNIKHLKQWKEAVAQLQEEYRNIVQAFRAEI